jgi:copper chaperone CopZ
MKKMILAVIIMAVTGITSGFGQNTRTEATGNERLTFGVRGNCDMCKKTIEKAAYAVDGVIKAYWDVDLKSIEVTYNKSKTNPMAVHRAIADSGYDTEKIIGNDDAYNKLHSCCKYDRSMKMSLGDPDK